jgi:site-specific DNA recombinase
MTDHLVRQIQEINKEMGSGNEKTCNLEKLISQSLKKLENISKIWGSSDFDGKRILHKTLFPHGIYFNAENHQYLTKKVNGFVELVSSISTAYCGNKKGNFQNNIENSRPVPESRLELPTFGL